MGLYVVNDTLYWRCQEPSWLVTVYVTVLPSLKSCVLPFAGLMVAPSVRRNIGAMADTSEPALILNVIPSASDSTFTSVSVFE